MKLIDKDAVSEEIERLIDKGKYHEEYYCAYRDGNNSALYALKEIIDTLEVKEIELTNKKTDWRPSKKQMESLHDMLKYNIGVFDYQKFMEVNSLYDDLTKNIKS